MNNSRAKKPCFQIPCCQPRLLRLWQPSLYVSETESCPKTLDDLRKEETLQDRVAQRLAQLDVEDDSSSDGTDGQDEDFNDSKRASRRSTGKSLRSGKTVKPTSKVVRPQLWPHSKLNFAACSNDVTYDQLSIEEFVAGPYLNAMRRSATMRYIASAMQGDKAFL